MTMGLQNVFKFRIVPSLTSRARESMSDEDKEARKVERCPHIMMPVEDNYPYMICFVCRAVGVATEVIKDVENRAG